MIGVLVTGGNGRMGSLTARTVSEQPDMRLVALVDPSFSLGEASQTPRFTTVSEALAAARPDVAVEFSTPATVFGNTERLLEAGVHTVVGASGLTPEQIATLAARAAAGPANLFVAPNFSLGAVLLMCFAQQAARHYERAEIIELHHDAKVDAPSATALRTAALMTEAPASTLRAGATGHAARGERAGEVIVHSVRLPGLVAHQEVLFGGRGELLTLRHDSLSRESFMPGVLLAIRRVADLKETVVGLENLLP